MNKIKKLIGYIRNLSRSRMLLSLHNNGYLAELEWFKTLDTRIPTDASGEYIPWCTYSFTEFIKTRLDKKMEVFEYGSGYSSIFYAKRVKNLVTVEYNKDWVAKIKSLLPSNTQLIFEELDYGGKYCNVINKTEKKYDLVIIDGRDRVNCIMHSVNHVKVNGLIVLDDSDRKNYKPGVEFLQKNGFKCIDFWGIAPAIFHNRCTTVFYKNNI